MNLYNLKVFVDAARMQSMTKASEMNNLSRPAVSHAIKKLESELGVELLVHQRRAIELTSAGRLLLSRAPALLSESENLALLLRESEGLLTRDFKIGSARTLATFNLLPILSQIREEHPQVSLQIQIGNSSSLVRRLENREIDLAFFLGDESLEGSKQHVVGRGHYVLIEPKAKIDNLAFALTEKRPETERLKVIYERLHSKPLPVFAEIHSWDTIFHAVNEGICGGLIPDFLFTAKTNRQRRDYNIVLPKVFPYEIKAVYMATKSNDSLIKSFINSFKKSHSS